MADNTKDKGSIITTISLGELLPKVIGKKAEMNRLAQICAVYLKDTDTYELSYSFESLKYVFETYRLVIRSNTEVPSITPIYRCAFFYENEIAELFGVNIKRISEDYHDNFYRINEKTPFKS